MRKVKRYLTLPILVVLLMISSIATTTVTSSLASNLAFSRTSAVNYADYWAKRRNSNYASFGSDCTNFTSQVINNGGYGQQSNSPAWYMRRGLFGIGWVWSNSWSVVSDFRNLVIARGWGYSGGNQTPGSYNAAYYGDILDYDWDGNGSWDHATVEVSYYGTDPDSKWVGDLVDQHTTDRYHAFWTLQPYNANWQKTKIGLLRVKYQ
jgi:hypothetical protein